MDAGVDLSPHKRTAHAGRGPWSVPGAMARILGGVVVISALLGQMGAPQAGEAKAAAATQAAVTVPATAAVSKDGTKDNAWAEPVLARDARLAGDEHRTRLVLDLDRAVAFRAFTLANPYRVIIDLSDVTFALKPDAGQLRRGLVSAYRFGVFAPGKARMVLEVSGPVAVDKAFVLDALDDQPARLVVDLVRTDAQSFAKATATAAEQRLALGPRPVPTPAPAEDDDKRPVIVLDPGHGGIDSGTTGYSAYAEKNIVLDTARLLRDKLEKEGIYRVVMTRDGDVFVPLSERVQIARAHRAALFISLHADALARGEGQARGASVYTLSETASDSEAAHLADKENKADLIAGVDLSDETDEVAGILVDLAQRETRNFSALFARSLVGAMKSTVYTHRDPLKSAGFRVLKAYDVPSVLVELGYMSSPADLKLLTSDAWRDRVTDAIMHAVGEFFARRVAGSAPPITVPPPGSPAQ